MLMVQKTILELDRPKTFIKHIRHTHGTDLHLVRTYDQEERPCWFLLKANERSLVKLKRTAYNDMIDLTLFGEVIASGWGNDPNEEALVFCTS